MLKEFLNDGEIVGEGADGGQWRTIGGTAKAAGGGQQESGFDEVEADGPGVELSGEEAVGPTRPRGSAGHLRVEGQDGPGVGVQIRDHCCFLRRRLASCWLSWTR